MKLRICFASLCACIWTERCKEKKSNETASKQRVWEIYHLWAAHFLQNTPPAPARTHTYTRMYAHTHTANKPQTRYLSLRWGMVRVEVYVYEVLGCVGVTCLWCSTCWQNAEGCCPSESHCATMFYHSCCLSCKFNLMHYSFISFCFSCGGDGDNGLRRSAQMCLSLTKDSSFYKQIHTCS